MPQHGGARPGAGRKPGSRTEKTAEIALRAVSEGISPLEVLLQAMRAAHANGDLDKAAHYARMAAPYCHPRLNAIAALEVTPEDQQLDADRRPVAVRRLAMLVMAAVREAKETGQIEDPSE